MSFLFTILLLSAVVACGKNGGSGSGSGSAESETNRCVVNGAEVSCDSIYDGLGVDILDAAIDVPATVTSSSITFNQARNVKAQGRRISCEAAVTAGEVYHYSVNGDTLTLDVGSRNITMKRVHGSGGIVGTWKWSGITDGVTFTTKLMTVVKSMNRVVMKTSCER